MSGFQIATASGSMPSVAVESKHEQRTETVAVVVTVQQQVPMQATFKVTVPRRDAENHDVLLQACDEQVQDKQDAFGYDQPQAGEWHYDGELQNVKIDFRGAKVIDSSPTST